MTGPDRSPAAQARRTALLLFWGMALVLTAGQFTVERPLYDRLFLNWIPAFLGCGLLLSVLPRAVSGWQRRVCGGLLLLGALGGGEAPAAFLCRRPLAKGHQLRQQQGQQHLQREWRQASQVPP